MSNDPKIKIVILIPCLNEEITIGKVIRDFQASIPEAEIIVFDNNSTDRTAAIAVESGAKVIPEYRPGKGYVVANMFRKVDADYYVLVDGDDTYSAEHVRKLLEPVMQDRADMAVGARLAEYTEKSFRPLHVFGNNLVRKLVNWIFNNKLTDIMSGYRAYSRELVQSIPILSSGFEVETEMTIRILDYGFRIEEVPLPYRERPEGSESKLRTFHDGFRVLAEIAIIAKAYKPFTFFGLIGLAFFIAGGISGIWVIMDYLEDEYVNKVPTAILATGLMLLGFGSMGIGILLNTISYRFRENMRLLNKFIRSR
ncbi:MAG: glycosyltransferase family 2 protein [SAR324 cluster bacterium]|jgi:glycosyltransferase involved in cell wall biosynthesis|nr:glycosyltransferase family 2 protein [SAR324 cluster bacterium]